MGNNPFINARLHWPKWTWLVAASIFIISLVAMAIRTTTKGIRKFDTGQIRPLPLIPGKTPPVRRPATRKELNAIRQWRQWMDSLKTTTAGIVLYDSILMNRPNLMDSVREVEEYYNQLSK
jgi:hypothetical protein